MDEVAELLAIKAIVAGLLYENAARRPDPKQYLREKRVEIEQLVRSAEIKADRPNEVRDEALRRVMDVFDGIKFSPR